jgi:hypothetical protein
VPDAREEKSDFGQLIDISSFISNNSGNNSGITAA